jgi:hypothetical protein
VPINLPEKARLILEMVQIIRGSITKPDTFDLFCEYYYSLDVELGEGNEINQGDREIQEIKTV